MGLFKRVSDTIRANLNALMDKEEDPEKLLDQYLQDMAKDLAEAEAAVARQLAVARRVKIQMDEALALVQKREHQALEALKQNREDLARKALEDKKIKQEKAEDCRLEYENCQMIAEKLKVQWQAMKSEYEKLQIKRTSLIVRAQSARAKKEIYSIQDGLSSDSTRLKFNQIEDELSRLEAEVNTMPGRDL